jgi:hypothetical protein
MAGVGRIRARKSRQIGSLGAKSAASHHRAWRRPKWIALALIVPSAIAFAGLSGTHSLPGISAVLADPLSVFSSRSPGARADGALTQSKPRLPPVAESQAPPVPGRPDRPGTPVAGGKIIYPEQVPLFDTIDPGQPDAVIVPEEVGFVPVAPTGFGGGVPGPSFIIDGIIGGGPIGGGGSIGGGGGDGIEPTPGVTPTPEPTDPVSAVPEPQTWAMMLLGFALLGMALRRSPRSVTGGSASGKVLREPCR